MKVVILQSNYIPWKGYFDLMNLADYFVIYDEVEYSKGDWRNRNKIKTPQGIQWLTIPVNTRGKSTQKIKEAKTSDKRWSIKHWKSFQANYANALYFDEYKDWLEGLYVNCKYCFLSEINFYFLAAIKERLNINTELIWSHNLKTHGNRNEKLVSICKMLKATEYISGPMAKNYLDEKLFRQEEIAITWMDYSGYPEYQQLYPPFEHGVTILDLLLNEGQNATQYMKSF